MSSKTPYTPGEWALLARTPFMVGLIITLAAPSGITGVLEESSAVTHALTLALQSRLTERKACSRISPLAKINWAYPLEHLNPADVQTIALSTLKGAAVLLAHKATASEAQAFKHWLLGIADATAAAAKEVGGLGIGGVQVNQAEEAALEQIRAALEI
ncbi:MAG: hypothetical protein IVW51_09325 [Thermaceae bacterium]|nr:hypothetical protein [Thermaceae bacterium]